MQDHARRVSIGVVMSEEKEQLQAAAANAPFRNLSVTSVNKRARAARMVSVIAKT